MENTNANSDNLFIFNKKQFTSANVLKTLNNNSGVGVINIDNYFADGGEVGEGKIEKISVGSSVINEKTLSIEGWINEIKGAVASWLCENNYDSTTDVINSNNTNDINAMLKVYASKAVNYLYN